MALAIASLVAPTAAAAADPADDRRGRHVGFEQRAEQARARANERAASRAWRSEARPAPAERAQPRMRGNWSRGDGDRPRAQPDRSPGQGWMAARAAQQSRAAAEQRQRESDNRERARAANRNWSEGRDTNAWRQERRGDRPDRRDGYRSDRRDGWRSGDRDNWRKDRDRDWRDDRRGDWRQDRRGDWRNDSDRDRTAWRDRDHNRWDRHQWRRDHRYDWQNYRSRHHSIYRIGRYYAPYRNYSYTRLSIGFGLSPLFYSSRYWIDDPWYYRLPPVYGPYRWVRYYDDALLVNIYTGEVVDVIYEFFW